MNMPMRWSLSCVALLAPLSAMATVVIQPTLERMTQKSDVVIHARVEQHTSVLDEDGRRVLTLSSLRVLDGLKGAKAGDTITLYQVGGRVGDRAMQVVGMNEFSQGEEVLVFGVRFDANPVLGFLKSRHDGAVPAQILQPSHGYMVMYGIGVGKYAVDRRGQVPMAAEQLGDVVQVSGQPLSRTVQPLDVFKDEVRRMTGRKP